MRIQIVVAVGFLPAGSAFAQVAPVPSAPHNVLPNMAPTFTTANASAIATGHYLGHTGDFSKIYTGFQVPSANNALTPFIENNSVLADLDAHFGGKFFNKDIMLAE